MVKKCNKQCRDCQIPCTERLTDAIGFDLTSKTIGVSASGRLFTKKVKFEIMEKCKGCPYRGQEGYIGIHPNCQHCEKGEPLIFTPEAAQAFEEIARYIEEKRRPELDPEILVFMAHLHKQLPERRTA